ncbi:SDH family Clp fold serine proteinase, partial [Ralstonia pseudosolanacearum]
MANWSELLTEIQQLGSPHDVLRRKYIKELADYTGRNVICYYSGWLQKPELGNAVIVNDTDKNGLMTTINGLDTSKGLDLVLHTPGGDTAATESIVDYLWSKFAGNIRCFVPQMAMSAGTMIACSCREIWMGKQSSLGPIDPQFGPIPAHGILEEFKRASDEIKEDPRTIPLWQPILAKYSPAFLGECDKVIQWSNSLVSTWLKRNMLANRQDADEIVDRVLTEL